MKRIYIDSTCCNKVYYFSKSNFEQFNLLGMRKVLKGTVVLLGVSSNDFMLTKILSSPSTRCLNNVGSTNRKINQGQG